MGITSEDVKRSLSNSPQLTFEITDACNLRCEYCGYGKSYSDYDERKSTRLSPQRAKVLLDYLSSLWRSELNVSHNQNVYISFYGGEPLMNVPFIKEIISYVEELDCPSRSFTFDMVTNGILLDHRGMWSITEALHSDSSWRIQRLIIKS
jgi:putative dehydrogenase